LLYRAKIAIEIIYKFYVYGLTINKVLMSIVTVDPTHSSLYLKQSSSEMRT